MMADLIKDLRSKQHDFDNHLTAVRMLPYTYRDYESLKNALINYSDNMVSEYRESERFASICLLSPVLYIAR